MRLKFSIPLVVALLGAAVAQDKPFEVEATKAEQLAIQELNARSNEIAMAKARLDADTAEIVSEIRATHHLAPGATFTFEAAKGPHGLFLVTLASVSSGGR